MKIGERLYQALARLDPGDREVLLLRTLAELNDEDTATILRVTLTEAKKRLEQAKERLRDVLDDSD